VRERAAQAQRRVGTQALKSTLPARKGTKMERAMTATQLAQENGLDGRPYLVMVDAQGVAYLRVEMTTQGARFIVHTGPAIEVVEMDTTTIRSRGLKPIPEASIQDAAKILAKPLTSSIIVSERSKKYLNTILNDKELMTMAKQKNAKPTKSAKAAASAKSSTSTRGANTIVAFKKMADEKALPAQALGILEIVKKAGKLTIAELKKRMEGKIETKQPLGVIWSFYRARLTKGGYLTVTAA
jgi:hypothetical protein